MGHEVFLSCKSWLTGNAFPAELNDTNIVLIPKKDNADEMKDLRPIAMGHMERKKLVSLGRKNDDTSYCYWLEIQSSFRMEKRENEGYSI